MDCRGASKQAGRTRTAEEPRTRSLSLPAVWMAGMLLALGLAPGAGLAADPTAPPEAAQQGAEPDDAAPLPVVRAVIDSGDRRLAVVDGRLVREGERVDYGRVERIERSAVVFDRDGQRVRVSTVTSVRGSQ